MTNELLNNELLSDEQLDSVTGGTKSESDTDAVYLKMFQLSKGDSSPIDDVDLNTLFRDENALRRAWAQVGVATVIYKDDSTPNEYYVNGKQITREKARDLLFSK